MVADGQSSSSCYQWHQEWVAKLKAKLWMIPLFSAILIPFTYFLPYLFAVRNKQIDPVFPFISDSGSAGLPSSHIFSSGLDTLAILLLITIWVRYKQVLYYLTEQLPLATNIEHRLRSQKTINRLHWMNILITTSMMLVAFGCLMVGNFRATEEMIFHGIGVILVLTHVFIANPCMVYLTMKLYRAGIESSPVTIVISTIIGLLSTFGAIICVLKLILVVDRKQFKDVNFRLHWPEDDPGYWWHFSASVFEWILLCNIALIALALSRRMRQFKHWNRVYI